MRTDKNIVVATALAVQFALLPAISWGQAAPVAGEVRRIDEAAGKITIKHGPMPEFDLNEGHTMVFRVQDAAMLKSVRVGDKINFEADRSGGQFTVIKMQKAK
jgi:Cu(I)/Ag(I) efflux system protein CusF